ncbi:hypothetical protein Harman_40600 [Haloarcula mannanilytica]|uniref:Uncharacterized protein n=2 Tax=Haloarcula mannanilytica TaxID=2509225 RepID=A0A4C2EP79_9EURY|nr:DUF6498-containing protein [Haloarcula mannanilytica]GCF16125.1 hypothetical protein Harman_40600 [Haloarcula mannanilytica]
MPLARRLLSTENSRRTELLSISVANVLPVIGVILLDWSAAGLLLLYWLELGIDSVWALVRSLFAGRPPEIETDSVLVGALAARQYSLSVPRTGLRVYLTTVVVLPLTVLIIASAWLFTGALLVGPLPEPASDTIAGVTAAAIGIFISTGVLTVRNYFYNGEYRRHNSQTAFRGLLFRMVTVVFGGILTIVLVTAATEGPEAELGALDPAAVGLPLLLMIIGFKFVSDYLGVYSDRLAIYFKSYDQEYGWQEAPSRAKSVDWTHTNQFERVRPTRWGRILGGPVRFPQHPGLLYVVGLGLLVAVLFAIGGAWSIVATISIASFGIPVLLLCFDQVFRYGTIEYRVDSDESAIIAYDRLFDTALWRIESWDETGLRVAQTPVDSLLGTETVTIEHADGEYTLPHLPDSSSVVAVFDRQPERSNQITIGRDRLLD